MSIPQFYVGCDISMATIDFVDGSNNTHTKTPNNRKEIAAFLKTYHGRNVGFAFEATGYYGLELQRGLAAAGLSPVQINPLHARRFAQSKGRLAKTDRIDAAQLAEMAKRFELVPTKAYCERIEQLNALITRIDQLIDQRAAEKKRRRQTDLKEVVGSIERTIGQLDGEIERFEKLIEQIIRDDEELKRKDELLQTIPGISKRTSAVLLAMLSEAGQINRRQIAALAGLAPFNHDSGTMRGYRSIAGGRRRVRRALYMAALGATNSKSKLATKYRQLREAGKPAKVALIAIARKIVTILNAILKTNCAYR